MSNRMMSSKITKTIIGVIFGMTIAAGVMAAGNQRHAKDMDWSFEGVFGQYDRAALQRGLKVYQDVCASCHSLKYIAFRNLVDIGFSADEALAIAANYQVTDGPDQFGDMFIRDGRLSDYFPLPFANEKAARFANNGALPPDLSLLAKARANGADYIYSVLTGYEDPPADWDPNSLMSYNPYFSGGAIAMMAPLFDGFVDYADGTEASVEQMAADVTTFLYWAAEPKLEARHKMGFKVLGFMLVLTIVLYFANRKTWTEVNKK